MKKIMRRRLQLSVQTKQTPRETDTYNPVQQETVAVI